MNKYDPKFCWIKATKEEIKDHIKLIIDSNLKKTEWCWEWIGYKDKDGYGRMKFFKKFVHSTKMMWYLIYDAIPENVCVCHKCDNPSCMNPDHLFLGSVRENTLDAFGKGRRQGRKGSENNFVKLKEDEVKEIKKMLKDKISQKKIGELFGVSRGAISDISINRNWKHVEV